jgi:hypothetical protein
MGQMHVNKGRCRGVHEQVSQPSKKNTYKKIRTTQTAVAQKYGRRQNEMGIMPFICHLQRTPLNQK